MPAKRRLLIQAGHLSPREPGFEDGTGTNGEQDLARKIRAALVRLLRTDGRFAVFTCGGRIPNPRPFKCDLFLSLHADGAAKKTASGYCYGYPETSVQSRNLAAALSRQYDLIPRRPPRWTDNYTRNLSRYYGFSSRRVDAPVKVLVEHGFLTNPQERAWLFANVERIARAHYRAILAYYGMKPPAAAKPKPRPEPVRVNIDVGPVKLRDQSLESPKVRARLGRLVKRFGQAVMRRSDR